MAPVKHVPGGAGGGGRGSGASATTGGRGGGRGGRGGGRAGGAGGGAKSQNSCAMCVRNAQVCTHLLKRQPFAETPLLRIALTIPGGLPPFSSNPAVPQSNIAKALAILALPALDQVTADWTTADRSEFLGLCIGIHRLLRSGAMTPADVDAVTGYLQRLGKYDNLLSALHSEHSNVGAPEQTLCTICKEPINFDPYLV